MTTAKELQKNLTWEFPHIAKKNTAAKEAAFAYCEGYKEFLNTAKTEREFTAKAVEKLAAAGYVPFEDRERGCGFHSFRCQEGRLQGI